ncbi:DVU3141 family protein [Roseococcus sp. YIM B11640]|uniref:DVU3141 family protein n=1 Tax=Roseococcus sp. YIM B11640 TaxID=3133973 RepID=UPI003C7E7F1D
MSMPDISLPSLSTSPAAPYADPSVVVSVPRGPDPLADFAAASPPGTTGSVNGERARVIRAYNSASGRECREIALGYGGNERTAVACRQPDGSFVSSRPLLRGSLR